jgi:hypothetical protein
VGSELVVGVGVSECMYNLYINVFDALVTAERKKRKLFPYSRGRGLPPLIQKAFCS